MSDLDERLRRDFLSVRERVERLPLPDITDREPSANRPRLPAVVSASLVVLLIAGAAVIAVRSRKGVVGDHRGASSSLPASTVSSSVPVPSDAVAHTVVFSDGGGVQQLNIDSSGPPTALPLTWPASLGGPSTQLALSAPESTGRTRGSPTSSAILGIAGRARSRLPTSTAARPVP